MMRAMLVSNLAVQERFANGTLDLVLEKLYPGTVTLRYAGPPHVLAPGDV